MIRPYVTERVLVLEWIDGSKVEADARPRSRASRRSSRASSSARTCFRSSVEGVYHADPHRGNVLLTEDGRLALLDFGLLGRLDEDTRRGLSLLLLAIAQNRADDVADLIISLSLTTRDVGSARLRPRGAPKAAAVPLAAVVGHPRRRVARRSAADRARARIALPTSFALVGKTLAQADAIARALDPELDPIALLRRRRSR